MIKALLPETYYCMACGSVKEKYKDFLLQTIEESLMYADCCHYVMISANRLNYYTYFFEHPDNKHVTCKAFCSYSCFKTFVENHKSELVLFLADE